MQEPEPHFFLLPFYFSLASVHFRGHLRDREKRSTLRLWYMQ